MLQERIRLGPRRLRVALDCGNGTAGAFAPEILRRWGCEVLPLYCDPDPTFPHHHPDPVDPGNLTDLIAPRAGRGAPTSASGSTATAIASAWWTTGARSCGAII